MTSQHYTNIHLFSEAENACIVQCSKEKGIKLTKKAWDKLVSVASTVDQYAINQKEGKWFLDANWYIHTKIIPKLIEPIRIYIGQWYLYNHKHLPKKEGMILNKRTWKQLKNTWIASLASLHQEMIPLTSYMRRVLTNQK